VSLGDATQQEAAGSAVVEQQSADYLVRTGDVEAADIAEVHRRNLTAVHGVQQFFNPAPDGPPGVARHQITISVGHSLLQNRFQVDVGHSGSLGSLRGYYL
jgi:hypothetical protein